MNIALVGAGGKMGLRITDNLLDGRHNISYLEVGVAGLERLRSRGVRAVAPEQALPQADAVILAVPDVAIEKVSRELVPQMKPGALLISLDPAAPLDGKVAARADIPLFIAHPCHPSVFNWEATEEATRDFYGGISARQSIVCALVSGSEDDYEKGVALARLMYAPIARVHRLSLEQMAILEPALVETLAQTCVEVIKEGFDRAVEKGVPREAARDFLLGHLRIQIAVLFGEVDGTFSDAAYKISARARSILFQENWQRIFEMDDIREQVKDITASTAPPVPTAPGGRR
jgi:ketol-acid reductoisomerase